MPTLQTDTTRKRQALVEWMERRVLLSTAGNAALPPPSAGAADPTFNGGAPLGLTFTAQACDLTSTGQTLLAGFKTSSSGSTIAILEELNSDGSPDASFGSDGIVTDSATSAEVFYGLTTLADGSIVVCGGSNASPFLARYNADGSPDMSFGTGGRVSLPAIKGDFWSVTADANGNIVAVGDAGPVDEQQLLVDRVTPSGAADPAFNQGQPLVFGTANYLTALGNVAIDSNDDIVAAGLNGYALAVARITPMGVLDSSFGSGGVATVSQYGQDFRVGLAIDSEGRILVASSLAGANGFATARLTSAGMTDTSFGTDGVATTDFSDGYDDADFVGVQPDGSQIIVAGTSSTLTSDQIAIAAYSPSGALDPSFGNQGTELISTGLPTLYLPSPTPVATPTPTPVATPADITGQDLSGNFNVTEAVFGDLSNGRLVVGAAQNVTAAPFGLVTRLQAPAPTATPLPAGTLGVTVSADIPSAVIGGTQTTYAALVTVTNPTAGMISGPVPVTLYASLGKSLGGAVKIVTDTPLLRLEPGGSTSVPIVTSLPSLPQGNYYIVATVTAPDGSESGAAGPTVTISPSVVSVVVSDVTTSITSFAPGERGVAFVTADNQGNVPVDGLTDVGVGYTDIPGETGSDFVQVPIRITLKMGESATYKVEFAVPTFLADPSLLDNTTAYLTADLDVAQLGDPMSSDGMGQAVSSLPVVDNLKGSVVHPNIIAQITPGVAGVHGPEITAYFVGVPAQDDSAYTATIHWSNGGKTRDTLDIDDGSLFYSVNGTVPTLYRTDPNYHKTGNVTATIRLYRGRALLAQTRLATAITENTPGGVTFTTTAGQTFSHYLGPFQAITATGSNAGDYFDPAIAVIDIDWGDQTSSSGTLTLKSQTPYSFGYATDTYAVAGAHAYSTPGTYHVAVDVYDPEGDGETPPPPMIYDTAIVKAAPDRLAPLAASRIS